MAGLPPRTFSAGLALLLLAATLAPEPSRADEAAELARRAGTVRKRLAALEKEAGDLLGALERVEASEAVERAALAAAEKKVRDTEKALAFVRGEQATTRKALKRRLRALEPRLVARYRLGGTGYLPLLLSSASMDELLRRRRLLARVLRMDVEAMAEIRRLGAMLEEQARTLETGQRELTELRTSAAGRLTAARLARKEREATLALVRSEQDLRRRSLADLERARKALVGLVRELPGSGASGFAGLKGRLPMPTAGAIVLGFGKSADTRYETVTVHKGVDIRAPRGAKVRAVAKGKVAHAGWLRGYGNLVIIDHGGGYFTLMAHLDSMAVIKRQEVQPGEVIGLVGDTGSLDGAHLYFEIREGGRAVDPQAWFRR